MLQCEIRPPIPGSALAASGTSGNGSVGTSGSATSSPCCSRRDRDNTWLGERGTETAFELRKHLELFPFIVLIDVLMLFYCKCNFQCNTIYVFY